MTNSGDFTSSALNSAPQHLCAHDRSWCVLLSLGVVIYGLLSVISSTGACVEHSEPVC